MKPKNLWLAALAGIIFAAQQASADDQPNLSCITEIAADGTAVRDCEQEAHFFFQEPGPREEPEPVPGAAAAARAHDHDGGPKQDRPADHKR